MLGVLFVGLHAARATNTEVNESIFGICTASKGALVRVS